MGRLRKVKSSRGRKVGQVQVDLRWLEPYIPDKEKCTLHEIFQALQAEAPIDPKETKRLLAAIRGRLIDSYSVRTRSGEILFLSQDILNAVLIKPAIKPIDSTKIEPEKAVALLEDDKVYSGGSIARLAKEKGLTKGMPPKKAKAALTRLRINLNRRSQKLGEHDGLVFIQGQAPIYGWFGRRWKKMMREQ